MFEFSVLDPAIDPVTEPADPLAGRWADLGLPGDVDDLVRVGAAGSGMDAGATTPADWPGDGAAPEPGVDRLPADWPAESAVSASRIDTAAVDSPEPWAEPDPGIDPLLAGWPGSWAQAAPDAALAGLLDSLGVAMLDDYDLVEAVAGWERIIRWASARQATAIAELAGRPVFAGLTVSRDGLDPVHAAGLEVSARLQVSQYEAANRVLVAQELTGPRRATLAALESGRIDMRRARILIETLEVLDRPAADRVEATILSTAGAQTPAGFRRQVETKVAAADPAGAEQRHQRALADRQVRCRPEPDAMGSAWALLSAADTALLDTVLDAAADAMKHDRPDDRRTHAQRRADALTEMVNTAWQGGHLGGVGCGQRLATHHGRRPEIGVLVPLTTLLGADDQPGQLPGYGPIPASVARRVAADGVWRRILTDPVTGRVLDYGTTRYTPPQDLLDHLIARDRTCRGPACDRPAHACDVDHTIGYPHGPTADWNTGPLCRLIHNAKTRRLWRLRQPAPGHFEWRSPTGHRYTKDPDPVGPITEPGGRTEPSSTNEVRGARDNAADPDPPPF